MMSEKLSLPTLATLLMDEDVSLIIFAYIDLRDLMVFDEALSANGIESSHHRYVNDIQNHFNHL
jgi:hypothetical protein